eukprot:4803790-Amphidinium_carterae.1
MKPSGDFGLSQQGIAGPTKCKKVKAVCSFALSVSFWGRGFSSWGEARVVQDWQTFESFIAQAIRCTPGNLHHPRSRSLSCFVQLHSATSASHRQPELVVTTSHQQVVNTQPFTLGAKLEINLCHDDVGTLESSSWLHRDRCYCCLLYTSDAADDTPC